jgi:hypothetical protein
MPGPRIESAGTLVDDDVQFGEALDQIAVRIAVIAEDFVPWAMPAKAPLEAVVVLCEVIEHLFQMYDVSHLKCEMVQTARPGLHEKVDGVVAWTAT